MAERNHAILAGMRDMIARNAHAMPPEERRRLVVTLVDTLLCDQAGGVSEVMDLIDLLSRDPDWTVRLEVARMVHLLDEETCSRYVALFRGDCNSYVRSHAERSQARQRKARQRSGRKRNDTQTYAEQMDQFTRQYGKRAAATIRQLADKRYELLSAAVAHDVRSILTTLSANAAALAEERACSTRARSILEDVGFLKRTIEAMEQFSKPVPLQRHPEDIRQMIQQATEKALEGVTQQDHDPSSVTIAVTDVPPIRLWVTRRLIVLALTNVIQNALESFANRDEDTLRAGRIEISAIVDGYEIRILVSDDGPGIEPEVLRELDGFVPTGPNKAKRRSSGWGLSIVHKYVTAHGGGVTIDSEMDRGTTVVITLPMRDAAEGDDDEGVGGGR